MQYVHWVVMGGIDIPSIIMVVSEEFSQFPSFMSTARRMRGTRRAKENEGEQDNGFPHPALHDRSSRWVPPVH